MRFWAGVLTALLLHAALIFGTRSCEPRPPSTSVPLEVTIAPPPPPPPPEASPDESPSVAPTPTPVRRPRPARPRPAPPKPEAATFASTAAIPTLGEGDVVLPAGGEVGDGIGAGAIAGGGIEGEGDGEDGGGDVPPGCRASDFRGIWVVDDRDRLSAFDPETGQFRLVGILRCHPRPPYEDHTDEWDAHPFSMAVDRGGRAWVLYTSGELFRVSTATGACQPTSWVPGRSGYELFALGFVAAPSGREQLYIAGGKVSDLRRGEGRVARLDLATLQPESLGPHPNGDYGPELTGTADGKLYAFYAGQKIVYLDGATPRATWKLPASDPGRTKAWAFAHWGGAFYLFASGGGGNHVHRFEPGAGRLTTVVSASPYRVVGAGVSTCAPTGRSNVVSTRSPP